MRRINSPHLCMFSERYFEVQSLLDEVLGVETKDGAGEGIVADVALAIADAEKRGAVKALEQANDELLTYRDELRQKRGGSHTRWALGVEEAAGEVRSLARRIESGEVTL